MEALVALSGGIDSAAAAALVTERGGRAAAVFMRHRYQPVVENFTVPSGELEVFRPREEGISSNFERLVWSPELFPLPTDALVARQLACFLGIPFYICDVDSLFDRVVAQFTAGYLAARTPNPCTVCNRRLKFGVLVSLARHLGAKRFITGHYVRILPVKIWRELPQDNISVPPRWLVNLPDDQPLLLPSLSGKDQSYVLWNLDRQVLNCLDFPLGGYSSKEDVRHFVRKRQLPIPQTGESQDICFIPNGNHWSFIGGYLEAKGESPGGTAGDFVDASGRIIGKHPGYERYTVGQRKGLRTGFGGRIFVQRIDASRRQVVLGPREALATRAVNAESANWLVDVPMGEPFRCQVKLRYRSAPLAASVTAAPDGTLLARLDEPFYGAAPGQSLVCYAGGVLLGGGVIREGG